MDPPLPEGLAQGVFRAQYRVETLHIVPVFGDGAVHASPRIDVIVDDLPWWWADVSDNNTVDIAGLPPGEHNVKIALVDANQTILSASKAAVRSFARTLSAELLGACRLGH